MLIHFPNVKKTIIRGIYEDSFKPKIVYVAEFPEEKINF